MGEADAGAFDLALAGLAAQVGGHLVDVGDAGGAERLDMSDSEFDSVTISSVSNSFRQHVQ